MSLISQWDRHSSLYNYEVLGTINLLTDLYLNSPRLTVVSNFLFFKISQNSKQDFIFVYFSCVWYCILIIYFQNNLISDFLSEYIIKMCSFFLGKLLAATSQEALSLSCLNPGWFFPKIMKLQNSLFPIAIEFNTYFNISSTFCLVNWLIALEQATDAV